MDVLRCTNCQKKDLDSFPKKKRDKLTGPQLICCRALGTLVNAIFIIKIDPEWLSRLRRRAPN